MYTTIQYTISINNTRSSIFCQCYFQKNEAFHVYYLGYQENIVTAKNENDLARFPILLKSLKGKRQNKERLVKNMGNKYLNCTALTIAIIGAINWGLIGLFRFDLVAFIFGDMSWLSRIIYVIVGLCGLYLLTFYGRLGDNDEA